MHLSRSTIYIIVIVLIGIAILAGVIWLRSDEGKNDAEDVDAAVTKAYTENDPSLCTDLLTPNFIKASAYRTLQTCRQTATIGANAQSVNILQTKVAGDTATALVSAMGGSASPKPVTLDLVKQDGQWKINGFAGG
jgi:hypothetical protein